MRRRCVIGTLLCGLALAGCASIPPWQNHILDKTVVILTGTDTSVSPGYPPQEQSETGLYSQLANWWNAYEEPVTGFNIQFDLIPGGATEEHSEMLAAAQAHDSTYDIYNLDSEWVSEFASGSYIRPLQGRVEEAGFLPGPLKSAMDSSGQLYAVPFTTDVGLLYYRTNLVKPAQVDSVHSFSDLIALARRVLKAHPADVTEGYAGQFSQYEGLTVNTLEAIWGHDRRAFGGNGTISDSGAVTAGLTDLTDAFTARSAGLPVISAGELSYTEAQAAADFAKGKAVFMRNWPIWYEQLNEPTSRAPVSGRASVAGHIGVTTLPFPSALGGQDLAIASSSDDPSEALQVVNFLTSPDAERCLFAVGGFPATRESAYASKKAGLPTLFGQRLCGRLTGSSLQIAPTILAALQTAIPRPITPYYTEFSALAQTAVSQLLELASQGLYANPSGTTQTLIADLAAAADGRGPPG